MLHGAGDGAHGAGRAPAYGHAQGREVAAAALGTRDRHRGRVSAAPVLDLHVAHVAAHVCHNNK